MVPDGWVMRTVGQLFDVQLGKMLSKIAKEKQPQYKYLGNRNVRWDGFKTNDLNEMHFSDREKEKFTLLDGDILMCEGGEVGRCSIWNDAYEKIYYQKALHRLRGKGSISPHYFQQYMQLVSGSKLLEDFTSRTSIAHLTREKLLELPVKCPPLPEQQKIAKILQTWDRAIATTEKLIEASKQQKKALMQQLLTGKKRFAGFEGEWEKNTVRNISELITKGTTPSSNGYEFKDSGIPFIKVECITHDGSIDMSKVAFIDNDCHIAFKRSQLRSGDVLFTIAGALGRVALVPDELVTANTNQAVCLIRTASKRVTAQFIYYSLQSEPIKRTIIAETAQAAQPNLSLKNVGDFEILIPTEPEQLKITLALRAMDSEIGVCISYLKKLKQEKKALMQQLLTGKRRVKVDD